MARTVALNEVETTFVGLLDDFARRLNPPVECRIAGGWVRDKGLEVRRMPTAGFLRWDLTINALFYNVHVREVEDFTGRGLSDLQNKVACTPLPPRQTFEDDPLRILRCVRFASRFDLRINSGVVDAIKEENVKVSKERIGIEVSKMVQKNPFKAMTLINDLGLHSHVFACDVNPPRESAYASAQILSALSSRFLVDEMLWLATAATPFSDMTVKRKGKELPAASVVISEGLKNPNVRPWRRSLTWATVMAMLPQWNGEWDQNAEDTALKFERFRGKIEALGLPEDIDKPLLLNTIRQALNAWQLDHPLDTKEECSSWLKLMWEGGGRAEWEKNSIPKKVVKGEKRKR
ncbi:uncharacterized protein IL334_004134 [Kwoniella shivajii]|uniref:Poly A polymerase head domain-containing protein n=1 Tax=Kwoniella shivajii TaxID=564305 RepID=A0ABZ1D030_9TREE|nr:hypothetical protein IL334_004134 [Kwoniella shivajii]